MSGSNALDPSIPLRAGQGVTPMANPLATMGQFLQVKNAMNQNALFPLQQQRMQQDVQLGDQSIATGQLKQAQDRANAAYRYLGPLLSKGNNVTMGDVTDALGAAHAVGLPIDNAIQEVYDSFPHDPDPATAGKMAAGWVKQRFGTTLNPSEQVAAFVGTPAEQTTGGTLTSGLRSGPLSSGQGAYQSQATTQLTPSPQMLPTGGATISTSGGVPNGAPPIPNTPSVGDMNTLHQVWDPVKKQFNYVPRAQVAPMVDGSGAPVSGAAVSVVPGLPTTGRLAAPPAQAPGAAASAPLGTPEEANLAVQHAGAARDRANNYQQTIQPIEGALNALQGADTGRASYLLNSLRANVQDIAPGFIQRMLPDSITDPAKRQDYEMAAKYLTGMAVNSPGGARSNEGQATAMNANPSTHISNAAATHVAEAILAQRRMEQAGTLAFNNAKGADGQPLPASEYDRFMNQWSTNQDPRAYIADKMAPADRAALVSGMGGTKSAAYQKFRQSYQQGVNTGVVPGHGAN